MLATQEELLKERDEWKEAAVSRGKELSQTYADNNQLTAVNEELTEKDKQQVQQIANLLDVMRGNDETITKLKHKLNSAKHIARGIEEIAHSVSIIGVV